MTTEQTLNEYFSALYGGDWQQFIADDFVFVVNDFDQTRHGKEAYLKGAGDFFRTTTGVEIRQKMIDGNRVALIARYDVRSPKGTTSLASATCATTARCPLAQGHDRHL